MTSCCLVLAIMFAAADPPGDAADEPAQDAGLAKPIVLSPEFKQLLQGAEAWNSLSPEARQEIVKGLRANLPAIQVKIEEALYQQARAKKDEAWEPIGNLVIGLVCAGPLLLLMPLFVARRYPGKLGTLVRYSVLASVMFSATVLLFAMPLLALSEVWEELALGVDPRLRTVHAAFELMNRNTEEFASRDLPIAAAVEQLDDGGVESFITVLLTNLAEVREQAEVFAPLVNLYRKLDWLFGSLPKLQCLAFAVLFVAPLYPVFKAIVLLPIHAAAGEEREGRRVAKLTMRNWWREIRALFALIALFVVILIGNDIVLTEVAEPATETMLNFLFIALDYLGHTATPSLVLVYFALAAVGFFYLFIMVVMTLGVMLYLQQAHRIFRLKFHERVPLGHNRRFWGWGTAALVWVQLLPLLFILLAWPAIQRLFWAYADADPPNYLGGLVSGGALLLFGILFSFWLARGFKALGFLWRYHTPMARVTTE